MGHSPPLKRTDLVPHPDPEVSADFDEALDIVGRHGGGLMLLSGPTIRLVSGYECRWRDGAFEPHPAGRNLVSGRKPMPYCHHGFLPHLLVPGEGERVELCAFLGTWGPRSNWGDGTERLYPQYELVRDSVRRTDWLWADGRALEVTAIDERGGAAPFSSLDWRFRHGPGFIRFRPAVEQALFEEVELVVPSTPMTVLVRVRLRDPTARVRLDARPMLARLELPPPGWDQVVDFLDPPFGWGRFVWTPLEASVDRQGGLRFAVGEAGLEIVLLAEGRELEVGVAPVDPEAEARAAISLEGVPGRPPGPATSGKGHGPDVRLVAPVFDASVAARPGGDGRVTFRIGAIRTGVDLTDRAIRTAAIRTGVDSGGPGADLVRTEVDPDRTEVDADLVRTEVDARILESRGSDPTDVDSEVAEEPPGATRSPAARGEADAARIGTEWGPAVSERMLGLTSGNRYVDGYVRWSGITLRSLVWPNDTVATGALGYGGMSHVGQDVPFVYPLLLMQGEEPLRAAARRNVERVWEALSESEPGESVGITDHPSDGLDFAFLPFDPSRARIWKPTGAAGLFRQIQMLYRYWRWTGDLERTSRWYERAARICRIWYTPFRPADPRWTTGLETQSRLFALVEAPAAFRALGEMAGVLGTASDQGRFREAAQTVSDYLDRPVRKGGYRLTEPMVSVDGQSLPPGLLVEPEREHLTGAAFSFDVLLLNALALWREAFRPERRGEAVRHLADRGSPWWKEGLGLAKAYDGRLGVWFWHNAVAAGALARCADLDPAYVDTAWQLLEWMGRGMVDLNGRGCPGEEIQGGDHAMAIGCLGTPFLVDGLLRPEPGPDGLRFHPTLPSAVNELRLENLYCCGRFWHADFRRSPPDTPGPAMVDVAAHPV